MKGVRIEIIPYAIRENHLCCSYKTTAMPPVPQIMGRRYDTVLEVCTAHSSHAAHLYHGRPPLWRPQDLSTNTPEQKKRSEKNAVLMLRDPPWRYLKDAAVNNQENSSHQRIAAAVDHSAWAQNTCLNRLSTGFGHCRSIRICTLHFGGSSGPVVPVGPCCFGSVKGRVVGEQHLQALRKHIPPALAISPLLSGRFPPGGWGTVMK